MKNKVITIDGPSGVGKGTLARFLANYLDWDLLDSGSIYRALAYYSQISHVNEDDENALAELALNLPITFQAEKNDTRVLIEGDDITDIIRHETMGMLASKVSAYEKVRNNLKKLQHQFDKGKGLVADGRDMGTVIFPEAKFKFFLDASSEVRANRRYQQLVRQGVKVHHKDILQQVITRDNQDRNRTVAPLRPAEDAVVIDTSNQSIHQVKEKVLEILKKIALTVDGYSQIQ
ncbi:(d)CMP kinase [Thiotrichales bacterium 19S11-10]|nr:(d)CMP kinase [Thiotrichales bacterium 19S11-10]